MLIDDQTLVQIHDDRDKFERVFESYAKAVLGQAALYPVMSAPRLYDAHLAWTKAMTREPLEEVYLENGLDHFKQCGHLAFWLRRFGPIVEMMDLDFGDSEGPLSQENKQRREIFFGYHNEYLAFDFGYQLCRYHEITHKTKPSQRAASLAPSLGYYKTACHFLKFKTVSPDAIYLIYHSLFYYTGMDIDQSELIATP